MKPVTVVVTGAAGFVGFHVVKALLQQGYRVVGIDSISDYYDVRLKQKRISLLKGKKNFIFQKLSITDYPKFLKTLKIYSPDEIIHLAAQPGVRYSLVNPWAYVENNYVGTLNVFEAAHQLKLPRVIYASSSSVYGKTKEKSFKEKQPTDTPLSIYAASKKGTEVLAYAYHHLFGIEMIGLRFFTVYGQWYRPDMALFIFMKNILSGKPVKLYNRGNMKRSYTHIDDVVSPILKVLQRKPFERYEIFNLGGSEAISLSRIIDIIENNLDTKIKRTLLPLQAGDMKETLADTTLARKKLQYRPKVSFEEGMKDFIHWFLENKKFLLSLEEPKQ